MLELVGKTLAAAGAGAAHSQELEGMTKLRADLFTQQSSS